MQAQAKPNEHSSAPRLSLGGIVPFVIFIVGWATLYAPVYVDFASGAWRREENAHAPFLIAIIAATAYARLTHSDLAVDARQRGDRVGLVFIAAASVLVVFGRLTESDFIISATQPLVAIGATLIFRGIAAVRRLWFPLVMSGYLVIWPGWLLDAITFPLKLFVSRMVSDTLYSIGLPVAHSGAMISAGPYQLLVADACAGLNSLIALTSVGAVYLYVMQRKSLWPNLITLAMLVPIAVLANLLRVAILVLITFYFGYDAGQSFLHEGAGLLMFAAAILAVFAVDAASSRLFSQRTQP